MNKVERALRNLVPLAEKAGVDTSEAMAVLLERDATNTARFGDLNGVPAGYHFLTNFSRDRLPAYQAAIAEYDDRAHKFYICTHATYGNNVHYVGAFALYCKRDYSVAGCGDTGDFWRIYERIRAEMQIKYQWED